MNAFEVGWMHAEFGRTLKQNPFRHGTGKWLAWRNGWREFWGQS